MSSERVERQKSNEAPRLRCNATRTFSNTVRCGKTAEIWERAHRSRGERRRPRRCRVMSSPLYTYPAAARAQELGQQIEAGRLAGAVRADQRMNGAALDAQINPVHRNEASEVLGQILGFEDEIVAHDATAQIVDDSGSTSGAHSAKAEANSFVARWRKIEYPDGRDRVVRHGHGPHRAIQTGVWPVEVRNAKVRDRGDVGAAEKIRFTSSILPKWARRTKSLDEESPLTSPIVGVFRKSRRLEKSLADFATLQIRGCVPSQLPRAFRQ